MSQTIFEKIIAGEIPSVQIYEDDVCIAIMDKFPMTKGQSLIIPKQPVDYVFDLDDATYQHIFTVAKKIARATDTTLNPVRTCLIVEGFEVPHAHIRLHPAYENTLPTGTSTEASDEELRSFAEKIKENL